LPTKSERRIAVEYKKQLLKTILSIPTVTGREEGVTNFLLSYASAQGWDAYEHSGNVYISKGNQDGYVPCFAAHTDTVHDLDTINILEVQLPHPKVKPNEDGSMYNVACYKAINDEGEATGCGGDDKAGVYIAIEMLHRVENAKAAFFRAEETGCHGSRASDDTFFDNVGYCIQFDSPENDRSTFTCNGVQLYSDEMAETIRPILEENGINRHMHDPYTDVSILKSKYDFTCMNLPAGYYNMHTPHEYVVIEDTQKSIEVALKMVEILGAKKHTYVVEEKEESWLDSVAWGSLDPYDDDIDVPAVTEIDYFGQVLEVSYSYLGLIDDNYDEAMLYVHELILDGEYVSDDDTFDHIEAILNTSHSDKLVANHRTQA
jgi:hypothetical protein